MTPRAPPDRRPQLVGQEPLRRRELLLAAAARLQPLRQLVRPRLQLDEEPGEEPLPAHDQGLPRVRHDVVDVLELDDVPARRGERLQIVEQRAVPGGAEEQRPVRQAERTVLGIDGQRVGGAALVREADLEARPVLPLELRPRPLDQRAEARLVLGGHREVDAADVLPPSGQRRLRRRGHRGFRQVLLDRRARPGGPAVEGDQALRQLGEAEAVRVEEDGQHGPPPLRRHRPVEVETAPARRLAQRVEEREARQLGEEAAHLRGLRAAGAIGEERAEHPRRGAGGGHEAPDPSGDESGRARLLQPREFILVQDADAVAGGARPHEARRRRRPAEDRDLPRRLLGRDARSAHLLAVAGGEEVGFHAGSGGAPFRRRRTAAARPASRRAAGRRGLAPR